MTRATRNITIGLVGSALMATCCITSGCLDTEEERQQYAAQHGGSRHTWHYWPRYYWWSMPRYSYSPSGGSSIGTTTRTGSPSRSTPGHSTTARGGFGSTGHAVAGG